MFERIQMVNHGVEDILLPLAFDFGADEVRRTVSAFFQPGAARPVGPRESA